MHSMVSLNENTFMKEYMGVMECSEQHARSVYIILDALSPKAGAEGAWGNKPGAPDLVFQRWSKDPASPTADP